MANSKGHSPAWPPYRLNTLPERELYFYEGGNCYDVQGKSYRVSDFEGLVSFCFSHNALVFVTSLTDTHAFPYLSDLVRLSSLASVACTRQGIPTSASLSQKKRTRSIVPYTVWRPKDGQGKRAELDTVFLQEMRELYDYCKGGVHATQGAMGKALMLQSWTDEMSYHRSPNAMSQRFLWEHGVGGRCDLLVKPDGYIYPDLIECDMATAYAAHFQSHATGTSTHVIGDDAWNYPHFFVECQVEITRDLALGPFPMRKKNNSIVYPTKRGTYTSYLWNGQIQDCQQSQCVVRIMHGWAWRDTTADNQKWARGTYKLRTNAPTERIEKDMKGIIVAGIGRHGMHGLFHRLVSEETGKNSETARILYDEVAQKPLRVFIEEFRDTSQVVMTHWYSQTLTECARSLYAYALPYAEQGTLLMTNYDALLLDVREAPSGIPEKHSLESKMVEMGDLRYQKLTHVEILGSRSLRCDQKTIRPGIEKVG